MFLPNDLNFGSSVEATISVFLFREELSFTADGPFRFRNRVVSPSVILANLHSGYLSAGRIKSGACLTSSRPE